MEKLRRFVEGENVDKHSFSDPLYDKARSETEENVHAAVEAAMKNATEKNDTIKSDLKRKVDTKEKTQEPIKRKKWMDEGLEDLSGSDMTDSDEDDNQDNSATICKVPV